MLPSAALIQPWRGAPPEPLGDGTQASFHPSLKSVERGSGRQQFGSGLPKSDWVIVSRQLNSPGQQAGKHMSVLGQHPGWVSVIGTDIVGGAESAPTLSATVWAGLTDGGSGFCA